ncbi:hypothetical protein [Streptomyces californicus]|uniref:hypothetical protein n=1 Tax=Streptomyces californicus TaxID=67351 RepID=UPI00296EE3CA|nr:hypothetical protein [Streptomyces californicus]MDW4916334.1 hypothetical protein [Streptomyces californicus]
MSTLAIRQESARLCAERLYLAPARAVFRVDRPAAAERYVEPNDTLVLIAVYDADGHRAAPVPVTLEQRLRWTRELARHAYAVALETKTDLTGEFSGFSVQLT